MWGVSYWIFPVVSSLCWLGMLLGLLIHWNVVGRPIYASMSPPQTIAYISDVGAQSLKPLFIAGSVVTTIFLDLSFLSERWLRHRGRLAANTSMFQKVLAGMSILFAIVGTVGLICLSIFDTLRHNKLHNIFLACFIGGYVVSAVFLCWQYQRLGIHFRQHRILRISFWIKLAFILIELGLAIAFGTCNYKDKRNVAAILEWAIAFIFTFYVFSFFIDLIPAVGTRHVQKGTGFGMGGMETEMQVEANDADSLREGSETTLGRNNHRAVNGVRQNKHGVPGSTHF